MNQLVSVRNYAFLEGGGEMGELTRKFDWSETPLGPVDEWPQSLKTTLGIVLHSGFPMFLWWGEELIQFYNDAYRPSLGDNGKHPKALGQRGVECWPEIWHIIYPLILQVKTTGESFFLEDQLIPIYRNGKLEDVYWTFSYSAVYGEGGEIAGVLVVCHETTRKVETHRRLEETKLKLEQSETNFRQMVKQAPVAMCILLGADHRVEIVNDLMLEVWGKTAEAVLNKPVFVGVPEARHQGLESMLDSVYATGVPVVANERPVNLERNGRMETVFLNFVYEPYRDATGKILGVLAITIDVTPQVLARQKIEEIVRERTASLEQKNAELSQFAYITSHDLQEPARKISTFIEALERSLGQNIDARSKEYTQKIDRSSARMLTLIRDVLNFSQLTAHQEKLEPVDLNTILSDVMADFELLIEQKKCTIHLAGALPTIHALPVQMSQLFSNLISNALKFCRQEVAPVIRIEPCSVQPSDIETYQLKPGREYIKIQFSGNGIGFSQENASQIFNIFQRLHGKSEYAGTGIGLAICKKIIENHEGQIVASSVPGQGSTFTIILPVHYLSPTQ
jgi:PAS domain S-box-containing protein